MTPSRVLERAIRRLEVGWHPYTGQSQAWDEAGKPVSYMHPGACQFTATGAVVRAIFEFTGDPAAERDKLWTKTIEPLKAPYKSWTAWYDFMHGLDKQQTIDYFSAALKGHRSYD